MKNWIMKAEIKPKDMYGIKGKGFRPNFLFSIIKADRAWIKIQKGRKNGLKKSPWKNMINLELKPFQSRVNEWQRWN